MNTSKAKDILDYWFSKGLYTPDYDKWFMKSENYDEEIKEKFGGLLKEAEQGKIIPVSKRLSSSYAKLPSLG